MNTKNKKTVDKCEQLSLFTPEVNHHHNPVKTEPALKPKEISVPVMDTVHQYFIIIPPPVAVKNKVRSLKKKLNRAVGLSDYNLHSIPHISLISFHTMFPVNERFIQAVQQLFSNNHAFNIKLKGFEHFDHGTTSNTIYAKLQNSEEIVKLYRDLHTLLGLRIRSFVPHLTIARTIARSNFEKSFSLVKKQTFEEEFVCNQVTILERTLQHGVVSKYHVLKEINFDS